MNIKHLLMLDELAAPLFVTEWGRRTGLGCLIVFALLFLITLIQLFLTWISDFTIGKAETINKASIAITEITVTDIPQLHLFGHRKSVDKSAVLPITSLQLRLVGVIKSVPEKFSLVIISESGQPGKVYRIGEMLPAGVSVYSISDDGVILDNGGHLEKLPLQRSPLLFQGMPKALLNESN